MKECFIRISNTEKWADNTGHSRVLINRLPGGWKTEETLLFLLFDSLSDIKCFVEKFKAKVCQTLPRCLLLFIV